MDSQDADNTTNKSALAQLKNQLRAKYLGRHGIHALGVRVDEDAICVYIAQGTSRQTEALRNLRADVAPHNLVVIEEPSARAH